jgi:hypothetical protein
LQVAGEAPYLIPYLLFKAFHYGYRQYHHAQTQHNTNNGYTHNQFRKGALRFKRDPGSYKRGKTQSRNVFVLSQICSFAVKPVL